MAKAQSFSRRNTLKGVSLSHWTKWSGDIFGGAPRPPIIVRNSYSIRDNIDEDFFRRQCPCYALLALETKNRIRFGAKSEKLPYPKPVIVRILLPWSCRGLIPIDASC